MSEPRNNCVNAVNSKLVKVINCSLSKPLQSAISIKWLSESNCTDVARKILIS